MSKFDPYAVKPLFLAAGILAAGTLAVLGSPYVAFAVMVIR
jgi:hypothetical protein